MTQTVGSTKSRTQWIVLLSALIIIIIFNIYIDWTLTGNQPDVLFYVLVSPVSILGSTLAGYRIIKAKKMPISFWDTLFIAIISDFLGQVFDNVSTLVYYQLWSYPVWLYSVGFLLLAFIAPGYMLIRWHKVRWPYALLIVLAFFIGSIVFVLGFSACTLPLPFVLRS